MADAIDVDVKDEHWVSGNRAAWRRLLQTAIAELIGGPDDLAAARAVAELEDARVQLRALFADLEIEWPEGLHLGDVVSKRLGRVIVRRQ